MALCRFCGQQFGNAQAVKAHLKGCAPYRLRPRQRHGRGNASGNAVPREHYLGEPLGSAEPREESLWDGPSAEFDEVTALQKRLATAQVRLQLRGVEQAHADLDEQAESQAAERERQAEQRLRAAEAAQREQDASRRRSEQARQEREQREKTERDRAECRRAILQQVKGDATALWWPSVPDFTTLKSDVLRAIERELATLPLEEIPQDELVQIAVGIRDRLTREAVGAQERANRFSENRERLIQHGIRYGDRELDAVDDLGALDKWQIQSRIKEELSGIRGDETAAQIEDLVEEILEAEGIDDNEEGDEYEDD